MEAICDTDAAFARACFGFYFTLLCLPDMTNALELTAYFPLA
jgi:hypothetical protein